MSAATSSTPILILAVDYDPVALGFVAETARGLVVTGDGLIRITESE